MLYWTHFLFLGLLLLLGGAVVIADRLNREDR